MDGLFPAANQFAHYSGVWTFGKLGADIGWLQDSQFEFDFRGSDVSLLLRQADYTGYLYPEVDNQPANAVPHDASGNAYIVLTSDTLRPELSLVLVSSKLSLGDHTVHVVADRGWDRWALAGFGVSSGNLYEPYDSQVAIGGLVAVLSTLSVISVGRQLHWRVAFPLLNGFLRRVSFTVNLIAGAATALALLVGMLLTWGDVTPAILRREPVPLSLAILTVGLIWLQLSFVLTAVAVFVLLVIIYNRLAIGLTLTLFFAPFFLFPVELYRFAFPLSEVLILITTTAWVLRTLSAIGRLRQSSVSQFALFHSVGSLNLVDYGVMAWVVLGCVSLIWAAQRPQAITELRVMIIEPALFYLIFRTSKLDRQQIITVLDAILLAGFVVSLIGLWQYLQGESIITAEAGARRLASVYGSPNNAALFLGRCLPFALSFIVIKVDALRRYLSLLALLVMGIALLLTQSVGALFLGVPVALFVVLFISLGKRRRTLLLVISGITLLAAFLVSLQFPRFARVLDFDAGTNFSRLRVWQSAVNIISDYPITGLGLDQFLYAFRDQYVLPDAWQEPNLSHPHNIVLDFWVRLGILGVVVLFFVQIAFWRGMQALYCKLRDSRSPLQFAIIVGAIGCMVNLVVHGLVDNSVFVQDLCYVFVFLLALASLSKEVQVTV
jgi:O-antigen ligase